jgi:hypothetical protein
MGNSPELSEELFGDRRHNTGDPLDRSFVRMGERRKSLS